MLTSMDSATPIVVIANNASIIGCGAVLAFIFWRLHRFHELTYLRLWMWAWVLMVSEHVTGGAWMANAGDLDAPRLGSSLLAIATQTAHYLHIAMMLLGSAELMRMAPVGRRSLLGTTIVIAGIATMLTIVTVLTTPEVRLFVRCDLHYLIEFVALVPAGIWLMRRRTPHGERGLGRRIVSKGLIADGLTCALVPPTVHEALGVSNPDSALLMASTLIVGTHFALALGVVIWALEAEKRLAQTRADSLSERTQSLMAAQKMEAIGRLAGGVAHDFNNVLTVMFAINDQLMATPGLPASAHGALQELRQAARQATKMTSQLLVLSRDRAGDPRVFDLNQVTENMGNVLRRLGGDRLSLQLVLHPERALVRLQQGHAEQVMLNLVINARDAISHHGTVTVRIDIDRDSRPNRVRLSVTDDGAGMSPEIQQRVLEPFFTTKGDRGTGLGLAVVYGIAQSSGGKVSIESVPGRGTTITLSWPEASGNVDESEVSKLLQLPRQKQSTVLLAEDEPAVLEITSRTLQHAGYEVLAAPTVEEALELAKTREGTIDALLTDVVMPGMNGPELATAIQVVRPNIKVLFISGYVDRESAAQMEDGVPLLSKPFTRRQLLNFLQTNLE